MRRPHLRKIVSAWLQSNPTCYEASLQEEVEYVCEGPFGTTKSGTGIVEKIEVRPPPPEQAKVYHVRTEEGVLQLFDTDIKPRKNS